MHDYGNPYVFRLHHGQAEENAQADAGGLLGEHALQPGVRAVIKQVQRQMPQSPANAQDEHAQPFSVPFLKNGLEKAPPAVLFSEKRGINHEEIQRKQRQIQPHIRICEGREKCARHAFHHIIQKNAQEIQE